MNTDTDIPRAPGGTANFRMKVQLGAVGLRTKWVEIQNFASASRCCRAFIETHDLGASQWRGGPIVDAGTKRMVATVSYNGRVWLADGGEAPGLSSLPGPAGRLMRQGMRTW